MAKYNLKALATFVANWLRCNWNICNSYICFFLKSIYLSVFLSIYHLSLDIDIIGYYPDHCSVAPSLLILFMMYGILSFIISTMYSFILFENVIHYKAHSITIDLEDA